MAANPLDDARTSLRAAQANLDALRIERDGLDAQIAEAEHNVALLRILVESDGNAT